MITRRRFGSIAAAGVLASGYGLSTSRGQAIVPEASTIVLVRHADKQGGEGDVPLTTAGNARAEALRDALREAGITSIITTKALRTQQTAKPLEDLLHLTAMHVERNQVQEVVLAKLPAAVLVVGHSDSVPDLVRAFGGPEVEVNGYDNLFIIIRANGVTQFIHGRYGAPSP